ncbi:MAG: adenylate/guanylate cyclase domain-containing protein, partial [Candidatus Tectomicrobia bacterium]|nr:adenylate/guanylate cyclase domain-containing protein [Candidatus Tectomicrobia bacterium]
RYFGMDGFLAIFGWPTWYEDHAQRALRVGLELQEHLRDQSRALQSEAPLAASVSMGLHTGPIELENRYDPYAAVPLAASETTRVAIRLHHLAQSEIILTSPATLPLLQESVEYVEHGSMYLPGHSGSTPTYRLIRLAT